MKKFNWKEIRDFIFFLSSGMFIVFAIFSLAMFTIYLHDKYEPVKIFMFICFGFTILSFVVTCITPIIDFVCDNKKRKKQKYVEPKIIIIEEVVV